MQEKFDVGSLVIVDCGMGFLVLEGKQGFTIAEVTEKGLEIKDGVAFQTLDEMESWFNEGESKISKIVPYMDIFRGEIQSEFERLSNRSIEDLGLTIRAYSLLKRNGINFESEIRKLSYDKITGFRNASRKSVEEIEEILGMKFE